MITDKQIISLQKHIHQSIPVAAFMQLEIHSLQQNELLMHAPLAPNINDKDCAFGGSLASGMTLAGWSLLNLLLVEGDIDADIFVADSHVTYLAPVWKDFELSARLDASTPADYFVERVKARGAARALIQVSACEAGSETRAATLAAQFVAKRRTLK